MKSLIEKAIKAIEDKKDDRAIGLLEGALEMLDEPKKEQVLPVSSAQTFPLYSVEKPIIPSLNMTNDPTLITDAEIKARLANVQKVSHLEIQ